MGTDRGRTAYMADAVLAVAVAALLVTGAAFAPPGATHLDPLAYLLLLTGTLAIAARRRAPDAVLLIVTVCMLCYNLRSYPDVITAAPVLFALYTAVKRDHRLIASVGGGVFIAGVLAINLTLVPGDPTREVVQNRFLLIGWFVAAGVMGEVARHRRAYLEQVEQRAAEAERTREESGRRRAGEERLRIARELHDSLATPFRSSRCRRGSRCTWQANAVNGPDALLAIQDQQRRDAGAATLDVLHRPEDGPAGSGLDRLPDLVERARSAGLPVTLTVSGQPRELPTGIDRAAYRVVQEALTNITRHAGEASASLHLGYGPHELTVEVDDDGGATSDTIAVPGVGLIGMRERITALGGKLEAGPRPAGGFSVRATLPVTAAS